MLFCACACCSPMNASSIAVAFGVLHMKSTSLLRQLFRACRMQSKINTRCITPPQRRDHTRTASSAGMIFRRHNFLLVMCRVLYREGVGHIVYKVLSDVLPERCSVAGPPPARHTPTTSPRCGSLMCQNVSPPTERCFSTLTAYSLVARSSCA